MCQQLTTRLTVCSQITRQRQIALGNFAAQLKMFPLPNPFQYVKTEMRGRVVKSKTGSIGQVAMTTGQEIISVLRRARNAASFLTTTVNADVFKLFSRKEKT